MSVASDARSAARRLPIWDRGDELKQLITDHQVVIVAGETGSGKSTQLPQMCLEVGRGVEGRIGHTQPRRIAARSVAERVATELDTELGDRVGYAIRFTDQVGPRTQVKVMTDGILLAEIQRDRDLRAYDTLIIDEAHERSLNIDFLLGYLKQLLPRRPDLKLIVTSATIDTERFSTHFDDAPIVEVSGRTYPVDIGYRPIDDDQGLPEAIAEAVGELWRTTDGDVLVFCSGERDIRDAADALDDARLPGADIFPLYARLSSAEQQRVFRPHPKRRIVLATNAAETSLTVPGIRSVVDPGLARISRYSARTKVQRLPIERISQASADQRAGRCGRVAPGVCLRLYAEDDYDARPEYTEPEITRTNLASVILQMASLGLGDIDGFPFVEPPDRRNISDGIAVLEELRAVDPQHEGTRRWLTPLGREIARLPVDPRLARMVIAAADEGCLREVLVIASALSVQDVRERPSDRREVAQQLHARFADERSDFLSILRLWAHLEKERRARSGNQFRKMCRSEFLHHLRIREWQDVHQQLRRVAKQLELELPHGPVVVDDVDPDAVHRALLTGFISQVGMKKRDEPPTAPKGRNGRKGRPSRPSYIGPRNAGFVLAPGSAAAKAAPKWVMAAELVETDQLRARTVAPIDPRWLESLGDHLLKWSYTGAEWDAGQGAAYVIERATMSGLPVVAGRRILLDRVNPELARELFIQHALVDPDWPDDVSVAVERFIASDVIAANCDLVRQAEDIEARARRRDLAAGFDVRFDFYDRRLPDDVTTVARFNSWWRRTKSSNPAAIALSLDDLLPGHDGVDLGGFPDTWTVAGRELALHYEFDATSPIDGLTIDVPVDLLADLDPAPFTWTVPGLRPDVIDALLRALPKQVRREFIPIAETAGELAASLDPDGADGRSIVDAVADHLAVRAGIDRTLLHLGVESVPTHLRPTFRVVGRDGSTLAAGKDLHRLQRRLDARARAALRATPHPLERDGLTDWPELPDGALPREVVREDGGHRLTAFPALVDERRLGTGAAVAVRLLSAEGEQAVESWYGTRRLLELGLTVNRRGIGDHLDNRDHLGLAVGPYGSADAWIDDVVTAALDEVIRSAGGPPWNATRFRALDVWAVRRLPELLPAIAEAGVRILRRAVEIETALAAEWPATAAGALSEVRRQLDGLVHATGLTDAGVDRLDHVVRYLTAIGVRLERLRLDPGRDRQLGTELRALDAEIAGLAPAAREELRWRLEELRVSVFAQHLGTDGPVSVKRVRRAIADAR